ncbi:MAG: phosphatase PAP2 family protein [Bdellovibrionales bacterium]
MLIFFGFFSVLLALPVLSPQADLVLSGLFYRAGEGFFLSDNPFFLATQVLAYDGARVLAAVFLVFAVLCWARKRALFLDAKAWTFLLLALLIGPGLVANVGFKDHWGRARPREVVEFGGANTFSPALTPQFEKAQSNGSFVSGDGAFGFFLPSFAYVSRRRLSRRVFWGGMAAGVVFSFSRLAVGAHFFSDIAYAAFFMLAACAGLFAAMYGVPETKARWKAFFTRSTGV